MLALFSWSFTTSSGIFLILKRLKMLRVSSAAEMKGMDVSFHGSEASLYVPAQFADDVVNRVMSLATA